MVTRGRKPIPRKTKSADELAAQAERQARDAGVEIEPEQYSLEWYRADWPGRKRTFIERELKLRNAFHRNKLEDFILNDAQIELYEASLESSEDPSLEDWTLKCRRLGISTYYIADYFADAVVESGHHVRIVAQDPSTLRALMKVVKVFYDNLRPEIKPASKYNSIYDLEFDDPEKGVVSSRISVSTVIPGHEEVGRGDTITRLHKTEIPFWRGDAETASTALDDATKGGKISGESTAKGVGDLFHRKYTQGKRKEGGVRSHFFEWWWNINYQIADARFFYDRGAWLLLVGKQDFARMTEEEKGSAWITAYTKEEKEKDGLPLQSERDCAEQILTFLKVRGYVGADDDWTHEEVARRLAWRRREISKKGAKKFRVEYPENDIDPFALTGGGIFDNSYLAVKAQPRAAEPGHEYKVVLDPSIGIEGADPAAVTVIDCTTGEQVYDWAGYEKQDAQAKRVCGLSDTYNGAEIGIESNMGEAAILEVERLGYGDRLYRQIDVQTQRDIDEGKLSSSEARKRARPGLNMTERVKRLIINQFEQAWRQGEFKACAEEVIDEARVFVQTGNTMGAKSGYHDDRIMANAICWFLVTTSQIGVPDFASSGQKQGFAKLKGY
jgi:hypothetical protein